MSRRFWAPWKKKLDSSPKHAGFAMYETLPRTGAVRGDTILERDDLSHFASAPCRFWAEPRVYQFTAGMMDAFDLFGVGESGEPWALEAKFHSGPGWHRDARAFAGDRIVLYHDCTRALSQLGLEPEEEPKQERLFEPDQAEVDT